jgi:hypothetical protein
MNHFFQQIEAALLPTATQYAPEGTEPKALALRFILHEFNIQTHHRIAECARNKFYP